jgi:hypothetical protein
LRLFERFRARPARRDAGGEPRKIPPSRNTAIEHAGKILCSLAESDPRFSEQVAVSGHAGGESGPTHKRRWGHACRGKGSGLMYDTKLFADSPGSTLILRRRHYPHSYRDTTLFETPCTLRRGGR